MGRCGHGRGLALNPLDRPAYGPLWAAARRRLESNGLALEGSPLVLTGLAPDQADAIAGLLGVRRPADGTLRVPLARLDGALRSSVVGCGLVDVLGALGAPLVDRRAAQREREAERAQAWAALADRCDPDLRPWLHHLRATGRARRVAGDHEHAAIATALDAIAAVRHRPGGYRLAVLAGDVASDPHALDRGRPAGTLVVHALSWLAERPYPRDAADWRRTWAEVGVACDDLSCDVLVLNVPGWPAEPLRLTLRQVSAWRPAAPDVAHVFVSENPAVIAAACDRLGHRSPTMVCLEGIPSTAALLVLDGLATAGCSVGYHGDFDWRGLAIAGVLARKIPAARPWRFTATDYRAAVDRGLGAVDLAGRASPSPPWDPELSAAMAAAGMAVYEEQVIDDLLDDLSSPRPLDHREGV